MSKRTLKVAWGITITAVLLALVVSGDWWMALACSGNYLACMND